MSRMGEPICFDTTPLIWGVRGESDRGQEHQIENTKRYIKFLKDTSKQIIIPAPVLSEYLIGASDTEVHELEVLKRGFQIASLDVASAQLAAQLQRGDKIRAIQEEFGLERQCIKADALIIAIAIVSRASRIITHNERHFKTLAGNRIIISGVPETPEQTEMPGWR
jgi:predicted nucleic acid-binding protein